MVAVLYLYLILWTYAVFIIDIADLGFSEHQTQVALIHGSNIYHSFVRITESMSVIPLELLEAIVVVAVVVMVAGFSVAFHGVFEITKAVVKAAKEKQLFSFVGHHGKIFQSVIASFRNGSIIKLHCRMNC